MRPSLLDGAGSGILRDFTPGSLFEEMIKSELHGDMQELGATRNSTNTLILRVV